MNAKNDSRGNYNLIFNSWWSIIYALKFFQRILVKLKLELSDPFKIIIFFKSNLFYFPGKPKRT